MMFSEETIEEGATTGVAHYTREMWTKLRKLYPKDDTLDKTYEEWQDAVSKFIQDSISMGNKF